MASTDKTTNYELSQFLGTDKPSWLGDYNGDNLKIDTAIKASAVAATDASTTANAANVKADAAKTIADTASTTAQSAFDSASEAATLANAASATATEAGTKASTAITDAEEANTSAVAAGKLAEAAQTSATAASGAATRAQTTADGANSVANSAKTLALYNKFTFSYLDIPRAGYLSIATNYDITVYCGYLTCQQSAFPLKVSVPNTSLDRSYINGSVLCTSDGSTTVSSSISIATNGDLSVSLTYDAPTFSKGVSGSFCIVCKNAH